MNNNLLLLIDGTSYLYRAFHAMPSLHTASGHPTGATFGITNMFKSILAAYAPTHAAVAFDTHRHTFRSELYADYKGHRPPMPPELAMQIPIIHKIVRALGFNLLLEDGVEADDVIGTLAKQAEALGMITLIFSGDKDFAQLVNTQIVLIDTLKDAYLDALGVIKKFEVPPALIVDYLTLVGDKVDNVPGVRGVGDKTAVKWLKQYGSLDNLVAHAAEITGKVGDNLRQALPQLALSRQLVTIKCDVPMPVTPAQLQRQSPDNDTLRQLFTDLEFRQWLSELPRADVVAPPSQTTILTWDALTEWLPRWQAAEWLAVMAVTTTDEYLDAPLIGLAMAIPTYGATYIPLDHDYLGAPPQLGREPVLATLAPLLTDPLKLKMGQHLKLTAHVLANYGVTLQGLICDMALLSYVLDSTAKHDLESLALSYLGQQLRSVTDMTGKGKNSLPLNQIDIAQVSAYACEQVTTITQLYAVLWPKLQAQPALAPVLTDIEMPLVPVLMRMERHGVKVDPQQLATQSHALTKQLRALEETVWTLAGEEFNLNSPKQLQAILFDKLGLPVQRKTASGHVSTAEDVLEELAHDYPLPRLILEYRSLNKLKSTYTDVLPQLIHPHTQRVHTSYQQTVTATGRLSSTRPNLQNIPIRTAEGRRIRQAFVAPAGYRLVAADYSQIELRIMAHLSQDENLLQALASGQDLHQIVAAEMFAVPVAAVTPEQRRSAKAVNFGLIYGMQAFGLAKQLGIGRREAQRYIDTYFARYPQVKTYMENIQTLARQQGYVETICGRRLLIAEINSRNAQRRQYAERTAINAPLQGSAADMIKLAMIRVDNWIQQERLTHKMIMQIHDELVLEIEDIAENIELATEAIRELMSTVVKLTVALPVNVTVGENWEQAH